MSYQFLYQNDNLTLDQSYYLGFQILLLYPDLYFTSCGYNFYFQENNYYFLLINLFWIWIIHFNLSDPYLGSFLIGCDPNQLPSDYGVLNDNNQDFKINYYLVDSFYSLFTEIETSYYLNDYQMVEIYSKAIVYDFWFRPWWNYPIWDQIFEDLEYNFSDEMIEEYQTMISFLGDDPLIEKCSLSYPTNSFLKPSVIPTNELEISFFFEGIITNKTYLYLKQINLFLIFIILIIFFLIIIFLSSLLFKKKLFFKIIQINLFKAASLILLAILLASCLGFFFPIRNCWYLINGSFKFESFTIQTTFNSNGDNIYLSIDDTILNSTNDFYFSIFNFFDSNQITGIIYQSSKLIENQTITNLSIETNSLLINHARFNSFLLLIYKYILFIVTISFIICLFLLIFYLEFFLKTNAFKKIKWILNLILLIY